MIDSTTVIDRAKFASMRKVLEALDAGREDIIGQSRYCLKASKAAIYAVHRNEQEDAKARLDDASKALSVIAGVVKKQPRLALTGAIHECEEEYAEASCYYGVMFDHKLPDPGTLKIDIESYLGGVSDLVGELVRKAVACVIEDDIVTAMKIRGIVGAINDEMTRFELRNSTLRRKYDAIKYGVEKLEDLALQLKLKGRL